MRALPESVIREGLGPVTVILYAIGQVRNPLVVELSVYDCSAPVTKVKLPELKVSTLIVPIISVAQVGVIGR